MKYYIDGPQKVYYSQRHLERVMELEKASKSLQILYTIAAALLIAATAYLVMMLIYIIG